MGWSNINWRYRDTPVSFSITYTNDNDYPTTITGVDIYAGTGLGTFGDTDGSATYIGPKVEGDGEPITLNVAGHINTIANQVGTVATEHGNIPAEGETRLIYVPLALPVDIGETQTVAIVAAGGSCLVVDSIDGHTTEPVKPDVTIYYDANGGVYSDGELVHEETYKEDDTFYIYGVEQGPQGSSNTVKFDPNGGVSAGAIVNVERKLISWNTEPDNTGTTYELGQEVTATEDITLYAVWGEGKLPDVFPETTRANWLLTDWNSKPDGTGYVVTPGMQLTDDTVFYAMWVASPIMRFTASGWQPWFTNAHTLANIFLAKSAHRKNLRDIEWALDKPVYMWTGTQWKQIHRGSKYPTIYSDENQPQGV